MNRLQRLEARRLDPTVKAAAVFNEAYRDTRQSESVRYAVGAMQSIDPVYTKNTFAQGDRVRDQLKERLCQTCEYRYQGSTTNDTHIRAQSDIDLLVILNSWYWLEPPQVPQSPYQGDAYADMRQLRRSTEQAAREAFPKVELDDSGAKSITLDGGSLTRRVDVVPATWYDTNRYSSTGDDTFRGVKVFDIESGLFISNLPFLHNRRIDEKDRRTAGGMRKAARLMKSLKYDSKTMEMSSYDIVSIAWNMPDASLAFTPPFELSILDSCRSYCLRLRDDPLLRNGIEVPNGTRKVFAGDDGTTLNQLNQLILELDQLTQDVLRENWRSFVKLAEARVDRQWQNLPRTVYGTTP